jgi:hypothetical protein
MDERGIYHRNVFDEIDNPRTVMEKTKPIRGYCLTFFPSRPLESMCIWLVLPILIVLITLPGALFQNWILPTPKQIEVHSSEFSEARALAYLDKMSISIGARTMGTPKNTETALWLLETINGIVSNYTNADSIVNMHFCLIFRTPRV